MRHAAFLYSANYRLLHRYAKSLIVEHYATKTEFCIGSRVYSTQCAGQYIDIYCIVYGYIVATVGYHSTVGIKYRRPRCSIFQPR